MVPTEGVVLTTSEYMTNMKKSENMNMNTINKGQNRVNQLKKQERIKTILGT